MRHARDEALDRIEQLLRSIRLVSGLTERKRGVFYRRSQAYLHFHEDGDDIYGDLKEVRDWTRYRVTSPSEQRTFLNAVKRTS